MSSVNYINHHKNVNAKMINEESITSIDISIYNALFLLWNSNGFCTTLSISRSEVMQLSKVGNKNTYTNSLKKLHELGYINYMPSNNPLIGSKITITNYGNGGGKSSGITGGKSVGNSDGATNGNSGGTLYKHYNTLTQEHIETLFSYLDSLTESEIQSKINEFVKPTKNKVSKVSVNKWTELELQGEMLKFKNDYDRPMLKDFYDYWTEKDKNGNMRINQPKYKTFEVGKRLSTWNRNNFNTKSVVNNQKTKTDEQQRNERVQEAGLAIWKQAMGLD